MSGDVLIPPPQEPAPRSAYLANMENLFGGGSCDHTLLRDPTALLRPQLSQAQAGPSHMDSHQVGRLNPSVLRPLDIVNAAPEDPRVSVSLPSSPQLQRPQSMPQTGKRATYALLPEGNRMVYGLEPEDGLGGPNGNGAIVRNLGPVTTPEIWTVSPSGISYRIEDELSDEAKAAIKEGWSAAIAHIEQNENIDPKAFKISIDYAHNLITIRRPDGTLFKEISVPSLPKQAEIHKIFKDKKVHICTYPNERAIFPSDGVGVNTQVYSKIAGGEDEETVGPRVIRHIYHTDREGREIHVRCKRRYQNIIEALLRNYKDKIEDAKRKPKGDIKRYEEEIKRLSDEIKRRESEIEGLEAAASASTASEASRAALAKAKDELTTFKAQLESFKKDQNYLRAQKKLDLLQKKEKELNDFDKFALTWILLTIQSFEEGVNFIDPNDRSVRFDLNIRRHRDLLSKFIFDKLSAWLPTYFKVKDSETAQQQDYAKAVSMILPAESRGEVVERSRARNSYPPALSAEMLILQSVLDLRREFDIIDAANSEHTDAAREIKTINLHFAAEEIFQAVFEENQSSASSSGTVADLPSSSGAASSDAASSSASVSSASDSLVSSSSMAANASSVHSSAMASTAAATASVASDEFHGYSASAAMPPAVQARWNAINSASASASA